MLDGLRGAASIDGGDVTVHQLFDYVEKRVERSTYQLQRSSFIANVERFYPLTRYPAARAPPLPPRELDDGLLLELERMRLIF